MNAADPQAGMGEVPVGSPAERQRVLVAVLTYRRPQDLAEVLPLVRDQAGAVTADVTVLVVDNDPAGGAAAQVLAHIDGSADGRRADVLYVHEPRPGIAAARNRALDTARSLGADALVFIDDDERPSQTWLALLLEAWRSSSAAGVVGPVVSHFAVPAPSWVSRGRVFDRLRHATGTRVTVAATNNLLLDLAHPTVAGRRFDDRFGITGGSDTLYTRGVVAAGGDLVWCDEAIVTDVVPAERATRDWVLRRAYRSGNVASRVDLELADSRIARARARVAATMRGAVRVAAGAGNRLLGALARSEERRARGERTLARGAGLIAGAWGGVYSEYRRPD